MTAHHLHILQDGQNITSITTEEEQPEARHPNQLWTSYFTSSKYVEQFREIHGEPDVIQIRKIFSCVKKCCLWEDKVLAKLDVKNKSQWLNLTGKYAFYGVSQPWNIGIPHTKHTKDKIGSSNRGKKYSQEINAKKSRSGNLNSMYEIRRYGKESSSLWKTTL